MSRRAVLALWLLAALLAVMTLAASGVGALRLPVSLLWSGSDNALRQIWLTIRLPRVLLALAIGGSLALAGCVMQGLFRNPLADPGLLGISSGAALAVALWVVLPLSLPALVMLYAPMLAAFLGALAATFVIFLLSRQRDSSRRDCWWGLPSMPCAGRPSACCHGSVMMPSFASSHSGAWAASVRPSGQRCWPSAR